MKVIFLRHGESFDEINKEFSGWSNRPPTEEGIRLARKLSIELKRKFPNIKMIYSSPLERAYLFAKVIATTNKIELQTFNYLIERNNYGLLNGLSLEEAKQNYNELIDRFDKQEYIPGSERYEDFIERIDLMIRKLSKINIDGILLCVTHGYLISTIIEDFLGKTRSEIKYGAYILCDIKRNKISLIESSGISFV